MPTKKPSDDVVAEAAERAVDRAVEATETGKEAAASRVAGNGEAAEQLSSLTDSAIDGLTLSQQQAMQTVENASHAMMEGVTRLQRELVEFVSERIKQDMEAQQAMLRCRNFDEMRDLQAQFFRTAMDQYSSEATKLMRLGSEIMQRSLERAS